MIKRAIFLLFVSDLCSLSTDLVHTWSHERDSTCERALYFNRRPCELDQFSKRIECVMCMIQQHSRVYTSSRKLMVFLLGLMSSWWKDTPRTPPSSASLTALHTHSLWQTSSRALSLSFKTHRHTYIKGIYNRIYGQHVWYALTTCWLTSPFVTQTNKKNYYSKPLLM